MQEVTSALIVEMFPARKTGSEYNYTIYDDVDINDAHRITRKVTTRS